MNDILRGFAQQQFANRNSDPLSRFVKDAGNEAGWKLGAIGQAVKDAIMAPGNALRGEYDQVGLMGNGAVTMTDPRMYDDASELAGLIGLGAMPMPRPTGSLGMGGLMRDKYVGSHKAPPLEPGATLNDPRMVFGDDIFSPKAQQYFGTGNGVMDAESLAIIKGAMDNPDALVPVYRAVPKGVSAINPGDWVTTSKAYANDHGVSSLGGEFDIIETKVPARQLATDGNSIHEWGWWPDDQAKAVAKSTAREVADMLATGRGSQVTDELLASADPAELWRLYESGATGQPMPMDTASRMARAKEMGFDVDTPLYHGTAADFHSFNPSFRGGVADAYSARKADWVTDSPTTAHGYADMAARDAPVARLIKASEEAELHGNWDQAHQLMRQAEALEASMPELAGQRILPLVSKRPKTVIDADGGGVNDLETSMRDALTSAKKAGDTGVEITNFSDHPDYSVTDPALHRGIFNASDIRSQYARFDPRLKHLGNLSAGVGGVAVIGSEWSESPEKQLIRRMLTGL